MHQTFRFDFLLHLCSFFTASPSFLLHFFTVRFTVSHCLHPLHFFASSPFLFHHSFHRSFFTVRFSCELVETFIAPFSSSSRTMHFWVSQLRIVLPLLYVLPLFYLFLLYFLFFVLLLAYCDVLVWLIHWV